MSEADGGLPEEGQGKLEQSNAVPVEGVGPWTKPELKINRQIFQNIDDLFEYGEDIILNYQRSHQIVIVIDNSGWRKLLYPNQPHYWVIEKFPIDPIILMDNPDRGMEVDCIPLYEKMVEWAEQDIKAKIKPKGSVQVSTYQGVAVYLPDPLLDYSRPETQVSATTGATTGVTVITTTIVKPNTAGGTTASETVPAEVTEKKYKTVETRGVDKDGFSYTEIKQVETLPTDTGVNAAAGGGRGNGAAEVAQRQAFQSGASTEAAAQSTIAKTSVANVSSGNDPCLPNNPPASAGVSGPGSTPLRSVPYQDAILRQARAAAAAPRSTVAALTTGGGRGNGAAEVAQRRTDEAATATAPTTVTKGPSTPTSSNNSATPRPPNVYIYEPLTPGFDRYDFNTGKKVYTPDAGPSRNASAQQIVPQPVPRVPSNVNSLEGPKTRTPPVPYTSATVNNATTAAIAKGPDQTVNYSDSTEANTGGWKPPAYAVTKPPRK